jgi:hypothetical protein
MFHKIALLLLLIAAFLFSQDKRFHHMSHQEIEDIIVQYSKLNLTITEKINELSEYFLGTEYSFKCVGDGPYATIEPWPLVNFKKTNCMAYIEHVLALAISDSWDHFFNNLQHIRYKNGLIGMKTRNHYTMADWFPQNSWLLEDVSVKVGGKYTKQVTRTISHKNFFAGKKMKDMKNVLPDRKMTINYVPLAKIDEVKDRTKKGDIIVLIFANKNNIFSAHMALIVEKKKRKIIRESSNSIMSTFDIPYDIWVKQKQIKYTKRYLGLAFLRVKETLNKPGKIIKAWEVEK